MLDIRIPPVYNARSTIKLGVLTEVHNNNSEKLAYFLSTKLSDILKIKELLNLGRPDDISIKEIHVIEATTKAMNGDVPARATDIAAILRVAPGTLTASMDSLEKKGYLKRFRDENDRRGVRVALTEAGKSAQELHNDFHREIADEILAEMTPYEAQIFIQSIESIQSYFEKKISGRSGKVKILADSTCDMSAETAKRLDVQIIPMNTVFGDEVFRQDIDLTAAEFYEKLKTSNIPPTTVQLTPHDLEQVYKNAVSDGSEVVVIHLSSALSGTYQSAVIASREIDGVYPVDSQSATIGITLLTRIASQLRDIGMSASEIADKLNSLSGRIRLYAYLPTLKYLVRGGRLSATAGTVGERMDFYPIISISDGAVENVGKVRGKSAAQKEIIKLISKKQPDTQYGVTFGHAMALDDLEELKADLSDLIDGCESDDCEIGAVIGTHSGPGAVCFAYISKE